MTFGTRLRYLRVDMGLTLKEVASRLGIGVGYLSDVERGARMPFNPKHKKRYAILGKVLGMDPMKLRRAAAIERGERAMRLAMAELGETVELDTVAKLPTSFAHKAGCECGYCRGKAALLTR